MITIIISESHEVVSCEYLVLAEDCTLLCEMDDDLCTKVQKIAESLEGDIYCPRERRK